MQDAIEAAQRSDTVVHILLVADPRFGGGNEAVAKKLTDETGGRTIVVRSEKKLEEAFDEISEELRSQYTWPTTRPTRRATAPTARSKWTPRAQGSRRADPPRVLRTEELARQSGTSLGNSGRICG